MRAAATTALHHRDAQRHDAVRRLTSLLRLPNFFCTWPSIFFFFFCYFTYFYSFSCFFFSLYTRRAIYHRIDANVSALATEFCNDVFVASTSRLSRVVVCVPSSFRRKKKQRQGVGPIIPCIFSLLFVLYVSIFPYFFRIYFSFSFVIRRALS